jgi:hypothetical protein
MFVSHFDFLLSYFAQKFFKAESVCLRYIEFNGAAQYLGNKRRGVPYRSGNIQAVYGIGCDYGRKDIARSCTARAYLVLSDHLRVFPLFKDEVF